MLKWIGGVIFAPAIISLVVSLYVNRRSEAGRARRDHITKIFEVTREDIRRSVEVATDYFATKPEDRTALQEAKVVLADRELRSAMPIILGPHPELHDQNRDDAKRRYQDLLAELTGANFQEAVGDVDKQHILRLAHAGAGLRSTLARMRDSELRMLIEADPLKRCWEWFWERYDESIGIKKD